MSIRFFSGARSIHHGMERQFLSERNAYNTQQLKLAIMFTLPVCSFLLVRFFLSGVEARAPGEDLVYPAAYSGMILVSLLFLAITQTLRERFSLTGVNRIQMTFILLYTIFLMSLAVADIMLRKELYAYLFLLFYLSVVIWLDMRVYTSFSLFALIVILFTLVASGTGAEGPFSLRFAQILIYHGIGWFLYFSLTSLLVENFFNRISLEEQYQHLSMESITDPLTGLYNKRSLYEDLKNEWSRSMRKESPFCLVLLDIDGFRSFNEIYGHTNGDNLIRELSVMIRNSLRLSDKVYRYGGEEFMILLADSPLETAAHVAERIRETVEKTHFAGTWKNVTASMGIAQNEESINTDILIKRVRQKLLSAKDNGRNRVEY